MSLQDHYYSIESQDNGNAPHSHEEKARIAKEKADAKRRRIIAIAAPIVVACTAFVIVLTTLIIPGQKNHTAALSEAEIGSYVFFGSYEQDNDTSNGKEDIEWIVLAKEDNRALVISRYVLDCRLYDPSMSEVTWETCALREWLNGPFLDAFSAEEQNSILDTTVTADRNPSFGTPPGNDVTDKVFLLSITEVNRYFDSDKARKCEPTDYAKAQGVWISSSRFTGGEAAIWWLRSPGHLSDHAAIVLYDGAVNIEGRGVFNILGGVRPALWIDLEP